MILLVCGGRDYANRDMVFRVLDWLHAKVQPVALLVQGGCRTGADAFAREWAKDRIADGHWRSYHANWQAHGRSAGPKRNAWMLHDSQPDLVLAFPGGRGTADMVSKALAAGVAVLHVRDREAVA